MKIDNHIGQRVIMHDDILEKIYTGYAFPTIGSGSLFLFVSDKTDDEFHDGSYVVDEYKSGFPYHNRCWWVSWSDLEIATKVIV